MKENKFVASTCSLVCESCPLDEGLPRLLCNGLVRDHHRSHETFCWAEAWYIRTPQEGHWSYAAELSREFRSSHLWQPPWGLQRHPLLVIVHSMVFKVWEIFDNWSSNLLDRFVNLFFSTSVGLLHVSFCSFSVSAYSDRLFVLWCWYTLARVDPSRRHSRALYHRLLSPLTSSFHSGKTIVLGGDGRYHNDIAIQTIIKMAAANGVGKILVAKNGIFATPAVSATVRARKAYGTHARFL